MPETKEHLQSKGLTVTDFSVIPWYVPIVSILKPSVSIKKEDLLLEFMYFMINKSKVMIYITFGQFNHITKL